MEKTKKEIVEGVIKKLNGDRVPSLFFINEELPEADYWYNEKTDSIETEFVSMSLSKYDKSHINCETFCKLLSQMEDLIMEYFKKEKGIILINYDD